MNDAENVPFYWDVVLLKELLKPLRAFGLFEEADFILRAVCGLAIEILVELRDEYPRL